MRPLRSVLSGAAFFAVSLPALAQQPDNRFFERDVRPLLIGNCTACHSGDHAQGGVRLDTSLSEEVARKVVAAIRYDGAVKMPPAGKLSSSKIGALEAWVKQGAKYPAVSAAAPAVAAKKHWAFEPVKRHAVPPIKNPVLRDEWVKNPIDSFILNKLEDKGLYPAAPASKRALIRRLTYDLTGLPPTPEEVEAFANDTSPDAYEQLVDRLLASPHYGEKWGRSWLDLVRYAETNSYERDNPKPNAYRFRDYVIKAFNQDKPYDRFIKEQLAGDELPDGGNDGLIATGFYRLGIWDDEPVELEQATYDGYDDIVTTIGQAFLGLTVDCARCHDHKIDPIPQKDYYRLVSFVRGVNYFKNGGATDEKPLFRSPAEQRVYEREKKDLAAVRQKTLDSITAIDNAFRAERDTKLTAHDLSGITYKRYVEKFATLPDFDALKPESQGEQQGFLLDLNPRRTDTGFGLVLQATLTVPAAGEYTFFLDSDDGSRLLVDGKVVAERRESGGEGNERSGKITLPAGTVPIRLDYFEGSGTSPMGFRVAWAGPNLGRRPLSTAASISPLGIPAQLAIDAPDKTAERNRLTKLAEDQEKAEPPVDRMLIATEGGPKIGETYILNRGIAAEKLGTITPGFLQCTGGGEPAKIVPTETTSGRRRALADWIADPKNPLTARVMVNRIWQGHFGVGIVKTPSDFGFQGARPTNPELLDWLTSEFIKQGWSIKAMHRLIVTSAAYQMSSMGDGDNELLERQNSRRLTSEEVRDSILAAAGTLNRQVYGISVYPDIPKEVLAGQSIPGKDWYPERNTARDKARRSIYIFQKRSLRYPLLENFDAVEMDRTTATRFASVQPMQALSLLNSTLLQEQAQALASRVEKEVGTKPEAFVNRLFSLVTQRPATESESAKLIALLDKLENLKQTPENARKALALTCLNLNEFMYLD
ncbi:MAG: DUF1549 domain-containing protein [Armatimonas sp.]